MNVKTRPSVPSDSLPDALHRLGLPFDHEAKRAANHADRIQSRMMNRPSVVMASVVYVRQRELGRKLDQDEIAAAFMCSRTAIRNNYRKVRELLRETGLARGRSSWSPSQRRCARPARKRRVI